MYYLLNRCFNDWHKFLKAEIEDKRLSVAVFVPNNHYLTHIGHITRKNGCMRAYSARSMERTIGRYSRLIKSKVFAGKNAGNLIEKISLRNSVNLALDMEKELDLIGPKKTSLDDYYELPSSSKFNLDHQLWSPFATSNLSHEVEIESVSSKIISKELVKYYSRSSSSASSLFITKIDISARALINNHVYSSIMYRRVKREFRRGNHYVLFHASINS